MSFYHVRITVKGKRHGEGKYNISEEELNQRFIEPYKYGDPIIVNGKTIPTNHIERIEVNKTESEGELDKKIQEIRERDRRSSVAVLGGHPINWRAAKIATDITDELINFAPGSHIKGENNTYEETNSDISNRAFIVHGHDEQIKNELEIFLHRSNIEPIVLHREPDQGLTILEKFEQYSDVDYVFVLLTPDDVGMMVNELEKPEDQRNYEYRARQNVIFELGYFIGRLGRKKVCALYKSNVELPSDISGLIYKKVDKSIEDIGYAILKEMQQAGLKPTL